jgi:hypothetical protein
MSETTIFVTVHQLSERTGLPVSFLNTEAEAGRLPTRKIGRHTFFDVDAAVRTLTDPNAIERLTAERDEARRERDEARRERDESILRMVHASKKASANLDELDLTESMMDLVIRNGGGGAARMLLYGEVETMWADTHGRMNVAVRMTRPIEWRMR